MMPRRAEKSPAFFVSLRGHLAPTGGGVQLCTHEYRRTLSLAGFTLEDHLYETDRSLRARLRRKFFPRPFSNEIPNAFQKTLCKIVAEKSPRFVFLNVCDAAALAEPLKAASPSTKVVLLSHGLKSTDEALAFTLRGLPEGKNVAAIRAAERFQRAHIDHVFCLTPEEAIAGKSLGTREATWLPRTLSPAPLDWQPQANRLGYVGTLDHIPNAHALEAILAEIEKLAPENLTVRIVGSPRAAGEKLAARFRCAHYLGALDDESLRAEAATWNAFLHPLFCAARGCSTKLATALNWGLPILTTTHGQRGYTWHDGQLPLAETPAAFAAAAIDLATSTSAARSAREQTLRIAQTTPTLEEVAAKLRAALDALDAR